MFVHQQTVERHHEELPGEMDFIRQQSGEEQLNRMVNLPLLCH